MPRILAAVDGSEQASSMADYIADRFGGSIATFVVVLNAQPRPQEWQTRGIAREAIHHRLQELGHKATGPLSERLEQAQIATKPRIEFGEPTDTIIRCAKEEGCDLIVMGAKPLGPVRRVLARSIGATWGSVAAQVVKLSDIPVVVVK
jgi:nucleotide-binding universal stress UspA family protein